jgi:hypothetical protein
MKIKPVLNKYEWFIHIFIVLGIWALYWSFPPYGLPYSLWGIIALIGIGYGTAGAVNGYRGATKRCGVSLLRSTLYFVIGSLIFYADIIRNQ